MPAAARAGRWPPRGASTWAKPSRTAGGSTPLPIGTDNIVTYLAGQDFVFGIGTMNDLAADGPAVFGTDTWTAIEPFLHAEYFGTNGSDVI